MLANCKGKFPATQRCEDFQTDYAAVAQKTFDWQANNILEEFQVELNWDDSELWAAKFTNASTDELMIATNKGWREKQLRTSPVNGLPHAINTSFKLGLINTSMEALVLPLD